MSKDWIKSKEAELVTQAEDMSAAITANPTSFGLVAADATALAADVTSWVTSYHLAKDPATRTPLTIEEKDVKKAAVTARMRSVGGRVRSNPAVSNAVKMSIGLHIKDASPSPVPPPATAPVLTVLSVSGRTIRARIADELTPNLRAKPPAITEYEAFTHVGESAPAHVALWTYQGQGTRGVFEVTLPNSFESGAKVWLCARWCNRPRAAGENLRPRRRHRRRHDRRGGVGNADRRSRMRAEG